MPEPPTETVWPPNLTAAICESCDWRYLLPPELASMLCPHCFQASLVSLADKPDDHPPELVIPFNVSRETVARSVQTFAQGIWFAPGDLTPQNLQARLQRLYLPMWLVDSQVQATWQAETGFNYDAISHRDSFDQNKGDWVSQRITETRIRWEPRVGRLQRSYDNIPAPALEEHTTLQQKLGAYNQQAAQPYQPQAINEAPIRLPNRPPADAWPEAVPVFQTAATEECRQACQADHIRDFRWQAAYNHQNWTLLLLPLYTTYYQDDDQNIQPILIHGQSGQLSGRPRASMKRARTVTLIIVAVAVIFFVIGLGLAAASLAVPRLLIFGGLSIVIAIIIGFLALIPLGIVWQFNRTHQ